MDYTLTNLGEDFLPTKIRRYSTPKQHKYFNPNVARKLSCNDACKNIQYKTRHFSYNKDCGVEKCSKTSCNLDNMEEYDGRKWLLKKAMKNII